CIVHLDMSDSFLRGVDNGSVKLRTFFYPSPYGPVHFRCPPTASHPSSSPAPYVIQAQPLQVYRHLPYHAARQPVSKGRLHYPPWSMTYAIFPLPTPAGDLHVIHRLLHNNSRSLLAGVVLFDAMLLRVFHGIIVVSRSLQQSLS